tara:strand:- start:1184 stop:2278 length:1095 start_codon:yes stop_codon:yes gene_type:complete
MQLNNTFIKIHDIKELRSYNIIKPNIQRIINKTNVSDIIEYQLDFFKRNNYFNFTACGPINIHVFEDKYYLVDGQHRMESLEILYNKYSHNISFYINWVHVNTWEELEENYNIINKNTPLPDFSCFENIDKHIPEEVAGYFQNIFPDVWSKTTRARRPQVFFNYFQEALAYICEHCKIKSSNELKKIVEEYNTKYSNWDITSFKGINQNIYDNACKKKFFLGLFACEQQEYHYEWAKKIVEDTMGIVIKKSGNVIRKKTIPKKIKNDSWDKYIGEDSGNALCLCCRNEVINSKNFVAGHIISESNGGDITVENILPICVLCNTSMGTTNMDIFVKNHYPKNYNQFIARDYKEKSNKTFNLLKWS